MQPDDRFFSFIEEEEGLRLNAYQDSGGVWTIGYGHTGADAYAGRVITAEQAKDMLLKDVSWAVADVNRLVKVPLTQNQANALFSFDFNIGTGQFTTSTLLRRLNQGRYQDVPEQLMRWLYDNQGNPVLKNRRTAEVKLWNENAGTV